MKSIYLDYNVIIDADKNFSLDIKEKLKSYNLYYSYGHLEELSSFLRCSGNIKDPKGFKKERINLISRLTKNHELICFENTIIKKIEDPSSCYKRIEFSPDYNKSQDELFKSVYETENHNPLDLDFNINAIKPIRFFNILSSYFKKYIKKTIEEEISLYPSRKDEYKRISSIPNINPAVILGKEYYLRRIYSHDKIIETLTKLMEFETLDDSFFNEITSQFDLIEYIVEVLFKFLDTVNYHKDSKKNNNTYRSKVFDVTHAIYASKCDLFITGDKKLYKKTQVVYNFLKINTSIFLVNNISHAENKQLIDIL